MPECNRIARVVSAVGHIQWAEVLRQSSVPQYTNALYISIAGGLNALAGKKARQFYGFGYIAHDRDTTRVHTTESTVSVPAPGWSAIV